MFRGTAILLTPWWRIFSLHVSENRNTWHSSYFQLLKLTYSAYPPYDWMHHHCHGCSLCLHDIFFSCLFCRNHVGASRLCCWLNMCYTVSTSLMWTWSVSQHWWRKYERDGPHGPCGCRKFKCTSSSAVQKFWQKRTTSVHHRSVMYPSAARWSPSLCAVT